jgi:hypothetical protein
MTRAQKLDPGLLHGRTEKRRLRFINRGLEGGTRNALIEITAPEFRRLHSYFLVRPPLKMSSRAVRASAEKFCRCSTKKRDQSAKLKAGQGLVAGFEWKPHDPGRLA